MWVGLENPLESSRNLLESSPEVFYQNIVADLFPVLKNFGILW